MASSVQYSGKGLRLLKKKLQDAAKNQLEVGWFESAKYDDNTSVAGVAAMQEFGTKTAPARPFVRPAIAENSDKWSALFADGSRSYLNGDSSINQVMTGVGLTVESDIRNQIVSGSHAPLSPVTIALRRLRNQGYQIGGKLVGQVAAAIAAGQTGAGQLGDQSFGNKDPLRETGYMLSTLTHEVSKQ